MVRIKAHLPLQNAPRMLISAHIRRYQSLNLNHVREHSMPIYEFRWRKGPGVMTCRGDSPCCPTFGWDAGRPLAPRRELTPRCGGRGGRTCAETSGGSTERRHAGKERRWTTKDQWQVDTFDSTTDDCLNSLKNQHSFILFFCFYYFSFCTVWFLLFSEIKIS